MFDFRKNKKYILSVAVILLSLFSVLFFRQEKNKDGAVNFSIGGEIFKVEVVSERHDLEKGLGGRDGLCLSCGMLFKFSNPGKHAFWMKDMKFPIDIIWIFENKIVHLEKNVSPSLIGTLVSLQDADSVLEINAGMSDKLKLEIGDEASF
ncbi:MAG: hypothetical protein ACD_8C00059G0008 [uncultured bacterium]|nr:MAG: hypothetical protein ACD_8C00059G0008 [uncultured bacterium]